MSHAEQITRLQTLLARVQKRAKEPRAAVPAPLAAVAKEPAASVEVTAPVVIATPPAVTPPVSVPASVAEVESTRDFDVRSLGIAPPEAAKPPERTEPDAAAVREVSGVDLVELRGLDEPRAGLPKEPTPLPMGELEEAPASSKRPKVAAPQTPPPESGPQEAAGGLEPFEVDLEPKRVESLTEATVEQLGQTVELEKPTEHVLELAPTAQKASSARVEPISEMEAEIPSSVHAVVHAPEADQQRKKPEAPVELVAEPGASKPAAPPPAAEAKAVETAATVVVPPVKPLEDKPVERKLEVAAMVQPPAAAQPPAIQAVEVVTPAPEGGITETVTVQVYAAGARADAGAAANFVGAVRTFHPDTWLELLDASLGLGG